MESTAQEILKDVLAEVVALCPEGTRTLDTTGIEEWVQDSDVVRYALISEYHADLNPDITHRHAPILRTDGTVAATQRLTEDSIRRFVLRSVERHNEEWAFIHSDEYAAALAKTRAAT